MPRFMPSNLRRLQQHDGRRRRLAALRRRYGSGERRRFDSRRYGVGQYIGRRHGARGYRARRHGVGRFRGQGNHSRSDAGPANDVAPPMPPASLAPLTPEVLDWFLAGPAAPPLGADVNADLAQAAPPPGFWCPAHGWVVCPLHEHGPAAADAVGQSPTSVFEFGSMSTAAADANAVTPRVPSPTPAVVEMEDGTSAYVSAPTGASTFIFGSGVRSFSSAATIDVVAPATPVTSPRLPSPTPATPLPRRRRLMPFGYAALSPPSSIRATRTGTWSPAALGLANGVSNGIAPGTLLPGGSSDEDADERGGSAARRR